MPTHSYSATMSSFPSPDRDTFVGPPGDQEGGESHRSRLLARIVSPFLNTSANFGPPTGESDDIPVVEGIRSLICPADLFSLHLTCGWSPEACVEVPFVTDRITTQRRGFIFLYTLPFTLGLGNPIDGVIISFCQIFE